MFLDFYGLREQPFGVTPNPRYLYHSPVHREALASLIYGVEADLGFAALIAEPGMGKTTLLFYLLEKFRNTARTALLFQTQCTAPELLRYLANEFEIPSDESDPVVLNDRIRELLVREARAGRRVIVIIDEAQNLSEDALEAVRLLSDFETPEFKLLHIILTGQPQLAEKLARPSMAQLLQRISMLNRLNPLTPDEIRNYIEYRLGVAGYRGPALFEADAIEVLKRLSGGVPRRINRLCFNALSLGCALQKRTIDASVVEEVGADLDIGELLYEKGGISVPAEEPARVVEMRPSAAPEPFTQAVAVPVAVGAVTATVTPPISGQKSISGQTNDGGVAAVVPNQVVRSAATTTAFPSTRTVVPIANRRPPVRPVIQPRTASLAAKRAPRKNHVPLVLAVLAAVLLLAGWVIWKMPSQGRPATGGAVPEQTTVEKSIELPKSEPDSGAGTDQFVPTEKPLNQQKKENRPVLTVKPSSAHAPDKQGQPAAQQPQTPSEPPATVAAESANNANNTMVVDFGPETTSRQMSGRPSRGVVPAALLKRVQPVYPAAAQQAGIEGTVIVAAVIAKDGRPRNVHAVSGNSLLIQAAVDAVRKWVYRPYLLNGEPADVDTQVVINFDLKNR